MNAPTEQMELTLEASRRNRRLAAPRAFRPPRRTRRQVVSRWWFARMREAVRIAPDWPSAEPSPMATEQTTLSLTAPPTRLHRRSALGESRLDTGVEAAAA